MDKNEQMIMVVEKDKLFDDDHFEGFKEHSEIDFNSRILSNVKYMKRGVAEQDPSHKQPIGYCVIINPRLKKIYAYKRSSKDAEYKEKRLQGNWSWGVGGHIDDTDSGNPINSSVLREIEEEIEIKGDIKPKIAGYINHDDSDVGKVHFGILYLIETDDENVKPKDKEMEQGEMVSYEDLKEIMNSPDCEVEGWSKIAFKYIESKLF